MKNFPQTKDYKPKSNKGFTLVELMVSVSVFVVIMTISMGAILTIFDANKKSQTLRTVMDNLNFSLESMTRTIRFGTNYHCDVTQTINSDCVNGATSIAVKAPDLSTVTYRLVNGRIVRNNGGEDYNVTSSDVTIDDLKFRVWGATPYDPEGPTHDLFQPQVIITIKGHAGVKITTQSSFSLQTTVSQRMFDSQ